MSFLEKEFGKILKIVGSLKFKQFEHETQLLNRSGVYVPEDSGEFVYNIIWSMIDEKEKRFLENEYKEKSPSHIPMWKFILYNYKITTNMVQKEPLMEMSSTEGIISNIYETEQIVKSYSKTMDDLENTVSHITNDLNEVNSKL